MYNGFGIKEEILELSEKIKPELNKVFEERNNLQGFFKKLVLPNAVFNKEITAIINDYIKGGESKVDASVKLATICNDEITCLEAAQSLYDAGDLYSAKRWLQIGNVANTNELFITIEKKTIRHKYFSNGFVLKRYWLFLLPNK